MSLILGQGTTAHRNELGPLAWTVLEEMALTARRGGDGTLRTRLSARAIAERLGINKDTACRAIGRLVVSGMLQREAARGESSGRFEIGTYVVSLPSEVTVSGRPGRGKRRDDRDVESGMQLTLLEPEVASG